MTGPFLGRCPRFDIVSLETYVFLVIRQIQSKDRSRNLLGYI